MAGRSGRSDMLIGLPEKGRGTESRHAAGRTCSREGCSTILSTYNRSTTCWLHTAPAFRHPLYHASP
jgi:hypothetical protein